MSANEEASVFVKQNKLLKSEKYRKYQPSGCEKHIKTELMCEITSAEITRVCVCGCEMDLKRAQHQHRGDNSLQSTRSCKNPDKTHQIVSREHEKFSWSWTQLHGSWWRNGIWTHLSKCVHLILKNDPKTFLHWLHTRRDKFKNKG